MPDDEEYTLHIWRSFDQDSRGQGFVPNVVARAKPCARSEAARLSLMSGGRPFLGV